MRYGLFDSELVEEEIQESTKRAKGSKKKKKMASSCCCSALLLPSMASRPNQSLSSSPIWVNSNPKIRKMHSSFTIKAAKLPAGLVVPKVEPKFNPPFAGFTRIAETWNSRACMIGLIGTFIVELILNKGILQLLGVEIGKGLDLPL